VGGEGKYVHDDKLGASDIRRSATSDAKGRERPLDLRNPPNKR
jgi:hypothetical protein